MSVDLSKLNSIRATEGWGSTNLGDTSKLKGVSGGGTSSGGGGFSGAGAAIGAAAGMTKSILSANQYGGDETQKEFYGDMSEDPIGRLTHIFGDRKKMIKNYENEHVTTGLNKLDSANQIDAEYQNAMDNMTNLKREGFGNGVKDNLSAFAQGAEKGSQFGPWGALIGGIAGGVSNLFSKIGSGKRRREYNRKVAEAQERQTNLYNSAMDRLADVRHNEEMADLNARRLAQL